MIGRFLEKKSISITRLKQYRLPMHHLFGCPLEKKSISITRLKLKRIRHGERGHCDLKRKASRLRDWNNSPNCWFLGLPCTTWKEKHLDYEIETQRCRRVHVRCRHTWKEKHLDYEIETIIFLFIGTIFDFFKRKASRLRDWNRIRYPYTYKKTDLKRKASRLRDWN